MLFAEDVGQRNPVKLDEEPLVVKLKYLVSPLGELVDINILLVPGFFVPNFTSSSIDGAIACVCDGIACEKYVAVPPGKCTYSTYVYPAGSRDALERYPYKISKSRVSVNVYGSAVLVTFA